MIDFISGAVLIMFMRICDVTIGTMRTLLVVQGRKYLAGLAGFCEVTIWLFAIRFIMENLNNLYNIFGYSTGFALGNILGVSLEQKIGLGFVQMSIISRHYTDLIADQLRKLKHGVTIIPGEGSAGGVSIILLITPRKAQKKIKKLVDEIDKTAFITIQPSIPFRGFLHGSRK
jgi:uncharacterized protein YebE (UPF0316 family)